MRRAQRWPSRIRVGALFLLIVLTERIPQATALVPQTPESIRLFAADCAAAKTTFTLGDGVCAMAIGAPSGPPAQRRIAWITPNGSTFHIGPDIVSDPQSDSIILPVAGQFAQAGTWIVKTIDVSNNSFAVTPFMVRDANRSAADLSIAIFAASQISAGATLTFTIRAKNNGPNEAQNVQIKFGVSGDATLLSAEQTAGLPVTWLATPQSGGTGVCTVESMPVNAEITFTLVYRVASGASTGASISGTATISSATFELTPADNVSTAGSTLIPQPCTVTCPTNLVIPKQTGQCGANATYSIPAATGSNCGTPTCNPPSGSFFPIGTTEVNCAGKTGTTCGFTVTVEDPQPPSLTCPPDVTVSESSPGHGLAVVKYNSPTTSDNCTAGSATCTPPSGSSFSVGITTVTCEIKNAAGDKADCSFTVTVESSDCKLTCPAPVVVSTKPNECRAVVNYKAPETSGKCGTVTCTPPSGSTFPVGTTQITCTEEGGATGEFDVTVQDLQPPVIANVSATPATLLPAHRALNDVTIKYQTSDNCSGEVISLITITSNEPEKSPEKITSKPGGTTARAANPDDPDWEIVDAHHVRLRADKSAGGSERIYTITITSTDINGNSSKASVTVTVPRK